MWHVADWKTVNVDVHVVRERHYLITGVEHFFYPRIQLTQPYVLKGSGALPFPEQWAEILTAAGNPEENLGLFDYYIPENYLFWATYDDEFIHDSGYTYTTDEAKSMLTFFMYMDEQQLER